MATRRRLAFLATLLLVQLSASPALPALAAAPANNAAHLYVLDGWGGVHPAGNSPALAISGYWEGFDIARGLALFADGSGGYTMDGFGGLFAVGSAPAITGGHNYWPGWDIARAVVMAPWATPAAPAGWILDGFGGIAPFGGAPGVQGNHAYWGGWDIARGLVVFPDSTPGAAAGYMLDGFGGVHGWSAGNAPNPGEARISGYWGGWDIARSLDLVSGTHQGYVMDGFGGLHGFAPEGTAFPAEIPSGSYAYWRGWDIARSVTMWTAAPAGSPGGWTLDGYGALHPFGSAPDVSASAYWGGWDIARGSSGAGSGSGSRPITSRVLDVPFYRQVYNLSCEEAALQMALAYRGISSSQADILSNIGVDYRGVRRDGGGFHWGDPYSSFVGNPSGSENDYSGYGTYFPTIASTARRYGARVRFADERYPAASVYSDILNGHPVVAWVSVDYAAHGNWVYTAFDGRPVQFGAPYEHAVTVTGVNPDSVLINDPYRGRIWMSKGAFEQAFAVFGNMAVTIS